MNTKISYMYRDAANYKIHCEEIIRGEISDKDKNDLLENHPIELEEFYPARLGFQAPTFVTEGYRGYPDDPDTHEIYDITTTNEDPTVNITVEEFVTKIKSGYAHTPVQQTARFDMVLKEKPAEDGLTIDEITAMLNMLYPLPQQQLFPVDIESKTTDGFALGFITQEAYDKIDYDTNKLDDFLKTNLFDTDQTTPFAAEYTFKGIRIYLSR